MVKDDKHTGTVGTNALEKLGDFYFVYVIFIFFLHSVTRHGLHTVLNQGRVHRWYMYWTSK